MNTFAVKEKGKELSVFKISFFVLAVICAVLGTSKSAFAKTYKVSSASDWKNIASKSGGTFKITKDIKLTKTSQYLTITKNKKYIIDLNGHNVATTYSGSSIRTARPLNITAGTVIIKDSSKKGNGIIYSTELVAVEVSGSATLEHRSGYIFDDFADFRSGTASAIYLSGKAKCYINGKGTVASVNNGVLMYGSSKCYVTGNPLILAGFVDTDINFTHYGSGIYINDSGCTLSLKGGYIATMANPDVTLSSVTGSYNYLTSGSYPVYDRTGSTLKKAKGYVFLDYNGDSVSITNEVENMLPGMYDSFVAITGTKGATRLATSTADSDGYYGIFVMEDPAITAARKSQTVTVKKKTITVSAKKLKKKSQVVKASKVTKGTKAKTKLTYTLVKTNKTSAKKYFKVAKSGKITINKKLKKGTYKLTIKATAAKTLKYKKATKNFVVTIRIK